MTKGIDISHWNTIVDFNAVRNSGIDFVIIKAGGSDKGFYRDSYFDDFYRKAKQAKLNVGAYYYVGFNFTSSADGLADANRFAEMLKGKCFEMPVFLDLESTDPADKRGATDAAFTFCNRLEELGYYAGIYGSMVSTFKDRVDDNMLKNFAHWVARYPTATKPNCDAKYKPEGCGIWQYTSVGTVDGIKGFVDLNICYVDYVSAIKRLHLNNY